MWMIFKTLVEGLEWVSSGQFSSFDRPLKLLLQPVLNLMKRQTWIQDLLIQDQDQDQDFDVQDQDRDSRLTRPIL